MIMQAMIYRPKKVATRLGTFGEVLYALAPKSVDVILNTGVQAVPRELGGEGREEEGRGGLDRGRRVRAPDARSALVVRQFAVRGSQAQPLGLGVRGRAALARGAARPRRRAFARTSASATGRSSEPVPLEDVELPRAAARRRRPRWPRSARPTPTTARRTRTARRTATSCAAFRGRFDHVPRRGRVPARRGRGRGGARLVRRARRGGDPVRRRHERRRRRRGARSATATPGAVTIDLGTARPRARGRPRLARGADPGRRDRARPRGPAARARPHAAPLPAVVPALDARRLDRHARRRSLRDALHAHRRPRRVDLAR